MTKYYSFSLWTSPKIDPFPAHKLEHDSLEQELFRWTSPHKKTSHNQIPFSEISGITLGNARYGLVFFLVVELVFFWVVQQNLFFIQEVCKYKMRGQCAENFPFGQVCLNKHRYFPPSPTIIRDSKPRPFLLPLSHSVLLSPTCLTPPPHQLLLLSDRLVMEC